MLRHLLLLAAAAVAARAACLPTCDSSFVAQETRPKTIVGYLTYSRECIASCIETTTPGPNLVNVTQFCLNFPFCLQCVDPDTGALDEDPYSLIHLTCASFNHLAAHANTTVALATGGIATSMTQSGVAVHSAPGFCSIVDYTDLGLVFCATGV